MAIHFEILQAVFKVLRTSSLVKFFVDSAQLIYICPFICLLSISLDKSRHRFINNFHFKGV